MGGDFCPGVYIELFILDFNYRREKKPLSTILNGEFENDVLLMFDDYLFTNRLLLSIINRSQRN